MVHDIDLKRWALQAQKEIENLNPIFKASPSWIARFKKSHRIVSRKVTKFVTRKTLEDFVDLQKTANDFLETVKPLIEQFGSENIYNSDQSGFQLEIYSGRSLDNQEVKTVERVVQSVSSTTHRDIRIECASELKKRYRNRKRKLRRIERESCPWAPSVFVSHARVDKDRKGLYAAFFFYSYIAASYVLAYDSRTLFLYLYATTHLYTVQPIISSNGKLLSPLFIVLKEVTGRFEPRVEENLFKPTNVIVKASKSGKLTSGIYFRL
ncbi:uncharacterized protein [Temnothorax longispinosus]|uniref:uncharacterized protein n=1 Tax=Temnothorax longispinosus TaxID=300112 RepID=UPI003A9A2CBD